MSGGTLGGASGLVAAVMGATLGSFTQAAEHIAGDAVRTPLLPFPSEGGRTIRLKAENVQPIGSFKVRSGANALASIADDLTSRGVTTASAGNFAQGLAVAARRRNVPLTVHVPDTAAEVKLASLTRLGAKLVKHPFEDWWRIMCTRQTGLDDGLFIHPVAESAVIFGNGTIGLELAQDWPQLDTVVVPFGGGGLISGISLALRTCGLRPRIVACEVETSTPLSAAFAAGQPVHVERHPSFVDGIGSHSVLAEMWPLVRELVDDVITVSIEEAKAATRRLAWHNHLIVEGAAAAALAAALSPRCSGQNVAVVLSGGNIDPSKLCEILAESA